MTLQLAEIRKLLDAFEQSDWDEVHLVADGVEVHIAAAGVTPTMVAPAAAVAAPAAAVATPVAVGVPAATNGQGDGPPPAPVPAAHVEGAQAVVSPSPGIFWRSPAPGAPPFVDAGQTVTPDTPIGIVEVMKLMNQVLAGVSGTVRAVVAENGARVDRDQPLVLVEP